MKNFLLCFILLVGSVFGFGQILEEGFDDIENLPGWTMTNQSTTIGTTNWFQGNITVFNSHSGEPTSYIGANFNNTTGGTGTISNWLITPTLNLKDGDTLTFWTRTSAASIWDDRLEVRSSVGAMTVPSGGPTDVGSFTTVNLIINDDYSLSYPEVWTEYEVVVSGVGSTPVAMNFAFRYNVILAGPSGTYSNYIGIDTVSVVEGDGGGGGETDCETTPGIVIHDDGTLENGGSGNPDVVSEVIFVDKFTPTGYPATIESVCSAFLGLAGAASSMSYDIVVYDDDGASGAPGTLIGEINGLTAEDIPVFVSGAAPVWQTADTSSQNWEVTDGSVYIGVRFAPQTPNIFIGMDQTTSTPVGQGYWWNDNAGAWATILTGWPNYRSLVIRPVLANDGGGTSEELLIVDLTSENQVTISATSGVSEADVSGSSTIGFYFENLFSNAGTQAIGTSTYEGTPTLTAASVPSDGSPSLFRSSNTDPGLNIWSFTTASTTTFTEGSQAFTGEATWNITPELYAAMLTSPETGNVYFPADDVSDIGGAAIMLGTYRVILPGGDDEGCFVTGTFDQWPSNTHVPACLGIAEVITSAGWAGEFSKVQVTAGVEYIFSSSITTDFITIAAENEDTAFATGTGSVTWTSPSDQVIRFFTHKDDQCTIEELSRSRTVQCGEPFVIEEPDYPCFQGDGMFSNAFEDGYNVIDGSDFRNADDFFVEEGYNFNLQYIRLNLFMNPGATVSTATFNIRADNAGAPSEADIVETFTISPVSHTVLGSNFGYSISQVEFELTTPVDLTEGTYWLQPLITASDGGAVFWEVTSTGSLGSPIHTSELNGPWTMNAGANAVFFVAGECEELGISDLMSFDFAYYPNPVKDVLNITTKKNVENVSVFNLAGQEVIGNAKATNGQINVSSLSTGTYVFKVTLENGQVETFKIIKK